MGWGPSSFQIQGTAGTTTQSVTINLQRNATTIASKCPTVEEIAAVDTVIPLSWESDPTQGRLECSAVDGSGNLTHMQAQVYRGLTFMRKMTFNAPLPWTSGTLYAWLSAKIRGIRFRDQSAAPVPSATGWCCDPPNVINLVSLPGPAGGTTGSFVSLNAFIGSVTHEARHSEWGGHPCGPVSGSTVGRDFSIAIGQQGRDGPGAWGVQFYTHVWIADHTNANFISTTTDRLLIRQQGAQKCDAIFLCGDRTCPL